MRPTGELPRRKLVDPPRQWRTHDVPGLVKLERDCWAPWLRKPKQNMEEIGKLFPEGQLVITDQQGPIAAMTANRIQWDGTITGLPKSWDAVVGNGGYIDTYKADGNTLCIMSSSVDLNSQNQGLGQKLMHEILTRATDLNLDYVIGPFRPSGFGNYKLEQLSRGEKPISFEEYCQLKRADGAYEDPWLRHAERFGMEPLAIAPESMVVIVNKAGFDHYRETYQPEKWIQTGTDGDTQIWECGETGTWYVNAKTARYREPNLWGRIPLKPE